MKRYGANERLRNGGLHPKPAPTSYTMSNRVTFDRICGSMGILYYRKEKISNYSACSVNMTIVIRYNGHAVDSLQQGGGVQLDYIFNFLLSVMAGVAGYYICKWLD